MLHHRLRKAAWLVLLTVPLSGCDGVGGYQTVTGSVTFRGEPLTAGSIQFFTPGEPPVLYAGTVIAQGTYALPKDHGLKPGQYLVRISSTERVPTTEGAISSMNPARVQERLPSKYNTESTLRVEVRAGEEGTFNFDLD